MQRHSHIFAKLAQQKVAQPAVQLEPGILVDQADRLHRHLDRDEQGEAETVVGVGRPAAVLHAHDAVELVLWHLRPEYLGHELLEGGVDGSEWVDVRNRQVGLCLLGDEHVDVAACLLADEDDGAEEEVVVRPEGRHQRTVPGLAAGAVVRTLAHLVVQPAALNVGQNVGGAQRHGRNILDPLGLQRLGVGVSRGLKPAADHPAGQHKPVPAAAGRLHLQQRRHLDLEARLFPHLADDGLADVLAGLHLAGRQVPLTRARGFGLLHHQHLAGLVENHRAHNEDDVLLESRREVGRDTGGHALGGHRIVLVGKREVGELGNLFKGSALNQLANLILEEKNKNIAYLYTLSSFFSDMTYFFYLPKLPKIYILYKSSVIWVHQAYG